MSPICILEGKIDYFFEKFQVGSKTEQKVQTVPLFPPPYLTYIGSPIINNLHLIDTFITIDEPT